MLADHGLDKDSSSEIWPKLEVRYLCRNRCQKIWKAADTGFVSKLAAYLLTNHNIVIGREEGSQQLLTVAPENSAPLGQKLIEDQFFN